MSAAAVYRFAIVGRGYMARRHIATLERHPRTGVSVVVGRSEPVDTSAVDAVLICSPDTTHVEYVRRYLPSGKLVLCEKPLGRTVAEFRSVFEVAQGREEKLAIGMNCRFRRRIQHLRDLVRGGALGDLHLVRAVYSANIRGVLEGQGKSWWFEYPPGILPFLHGGAIHVLDALRFLAGEIEQVLCVPGSSPEARGLGGDTFVILARFASGALGEVIITGTSRAPNRLQVSLEGAGGSVDEHRVYLAAGADAPNGVPLPDEDALDVDRQLAHLVDVLDGTASPLNTLREAYRNFLVIRACEASAASGSWTPVSAENASSVSREGIHG